MEQFFLILNGFYFNQQIFTAHSQFKCDNGAFENCNLFNFELIESVWKKCRRSRNSSKCEASDSCICSCSHRCQKRRQILCFSICNIRSVASTATNAPNHQEKRSNHEQKRLQKKKTKIKMIKNWSRWEFSEIKIYFHFKSDLAFCPQLNNLRRTLQDSICRHSFVFDHISSQLNGL